MLSRIFACPQSFPNISGKWMQMAHIIIYQHPGQSNRHHRKTSPKVWCAACSHLLKIFLIATFIWMALHGNEAVSLSTQELPEKHPTCHRKHPIPLEYEGKRGSTRKKTHTPKKQLIGGKKRTWKKHQQKQGPSWSQHLWHWRRRPKSHRLSPSAQLMCDVDQLVSFKGEVLLHWIRVSGIATPVCRTCWVYLNLPLLSYIYSHTVYCLVVIVLIHKVNSLT